jgi:hypothetical protein
MGQYKIKIMPSTLPDSNGRKDLVLVAEDNHEGSRTGECLGVRTKYHVTVIDDEDLRCPGQTLHVGVSEEGQYVFSLGHPDGALREITESELSEMKFEFVPAPPIL